MNGNKDEVIGGPHTDGNPHIRPACTLPGHNAPYSDCQNFNSGRNEGRTGISAAQKWPSRTNVSSEERGGRQGNRVLKLANAASSRDSSPEEISSRIAEQGQASKPPGHRNPFFRTKPCRFYAKPGGCVKGDRCHFIHADPDARDPKGLVIAVDSEASPQNKPESELSGVEASVRDDTLSPLSLSTTATSEHAKPNKRLYLARTRVVGGGVMLSGKHNVWEASMAGQCLEGVDCHYAHIDSSQPEPECLVTYPKPPPTYYFVSLMGPLVIYARPFMHPEISPSQPFALPVMPGRWMSSATPLPPAAFAETQDETARYGDVHTALPSSMTSPDAQPSELPCPSYSLHRAIDSSTPVFGETQHSCLYAEGVLHAETPCAARSIVRPVSTPPNRLHVRGEGFAQLFAAEMP